MNEFTNSYMVTRDEEMDRQPDSGNESELSLYMSDGNGAGSPQIDDIPSQKEIYPEQLALSRSQEEGSDEELPELVLHKKFSSTYLGFGSMVYNSTSFTFA
jgi:hypothetical protein